MTYFKVKTANFAERWQVCTPVEVAAQIIALARLDLPLIEYSWEFCRIAKAMSFDDATILSLFWHGANLHRLVDLPDTTGLKWREGILRCLESVLPWARARASPPSSAAPTCPPPFAAHSLPPFAAHASPPPSAALPHTPSFAAKAGSEYGKTACSEYGKPAGRSSFQASASTAPSRACSSSAPSRARSSSVPSRARSSTAPSSASPSSALSCARASQAPQSVRASRVPPSVRASTAPPKVRTSRASPRVRASRVAQVPDRASIFPKEIFLGGSRAPASEAGAGAGAAASEAVPPWPPEFPDPPWPPESPDPPWPPELPAPPWPPESPDPPWLPELPAPPWVPERAPPWRPPVLSCLRVPGGLQSAHPPLPVGWCPTPFGRGELCQTCVPHVLCFPPSCDHIWSSCSCPSSFSV